MMISPPCASTSVLASGVPFGEAVYVQIVVSGSTAKPTATDADESYTSTPTTAATSTAEVIATTASTATTESIATVT